MWVSPTCTSGALGGRRAAIIVALLTLLVDAATAAAQKRVFLTEEKALEKVLGGSGSMRTRVITLSDGDAESLAAEVGVAILDTVHTFYEAVANDVVIRRAVIVNVLGQHQPITFVVGIHPEGMVDRVEIMVYRETRGSEVRRRAFLAQFEEKSLDDPMRINDDIMNITGATISSRAVADGVRLALHLHERLATSTVGDRGQP